ncbi:hypothetical protein Lal_00018793 [Lupinus albus]|nr:hypothetical protein Lal_00018793 [Lupinus albus]
MTETTRVPCNFGKSIAFTIDNDASPYHFAIAIGYKNADATIVDVDLKQGIESSKWIPMFRSLGAARWVLNPCTNLTPPFSLKLTKAEKGDTKKTAVAENVIPINWKPGQVYRSFVKF